MSSHRVGLLTSALYLLPLQVIPAGELTLMKEIAQGAEGKVYLVSGLGTRCRSKNEREKERNNYTKSSFVRTVKEALRLCKQKRYSKPSLPVTGIQDTSVCASTLGALKVLRAIS